MWPIGRHSASGLSLLLASFRCFFNSAAQGWNGSPPGIPAPTSKNVASGGVPGGGVGGTAFAPRAPPGGRPHWPDRSGLPSGVRGVGASRFTAPLASRGTFGVVCFAHCAETTDDSATTNATTPAPHVSLILASVEAKKISRRSRALYCWLVK